jgi:hypothetical protein
MRVGEIGVLGILVGLALGCSRSSFMPPEGSTGAAGGQGFRDAGGSSDAQDWPDTNEAGADALVPGTPEWQAAMGAQVNAAIQKYSILNLGPENMTVTLALAVDDTYVYWSQSAYKIMRARKDGSSGGEAIATFPLNPLGYELASDNKYLFWLDQTRLLRMPRDAKNAQEEFPLPWNFEGGDMLLSGDYVYLAMFGCPAIVRYQRDTLARDDTYIDGVTRPATGTTGLFKVGDALVCGSGSNIFVIDQWGGTARKIVDNVERLWALTVFENTVFWIDHPFDVNVPFAIGATPLAGGAAQLFRAPGGDPSPLFALPTERLLVFTGIGVSTFSISTHEFRFLVRLRGGSDSIAVDDAYVYTISASYSATPTSVHLLRIPIADLAQ